MRIPDINRLGKCEELLSRVIDNLGKVADNLYRQDLECTKEYREVQEYSQAAHELLQNILLTRKVAWEDTPEEVKKKYINKLL